MNIKTPELQERKAFICTGTKHNCVSADFLASVFVSNTVGIQTARAEISFKNLPIQHQQEAGSSGVSSKNSLGSSYSSCLEGDLEIKKDPPVERILSNQNTLCVLKLRPFL
jgi:hypothetical protein